MIAAATATDVLADYASSVEAGSNVYEGISEQLRYRLYSLPFPSIMSNSMYPLMGIFAVLAFLLALSLVLRLLDRPSFWLVKQTSDPRSQFNFITPHYAVAWQLLTLVFLLCLVAFCQHTYLFVQGRHRDHFVPWSTLCWLPSFLSGFVVIWTLSVSQAARKRSDRASWHTDPRLLNYGFTLGFLASIVLMISLSLVCSRAYNAAMHKYLDTQSVLRNLTSTFGSSTAQQIDVALRQQVAPVLQQHLDLYAKFLPLWRAVWAAWMALTLSLYVIFAVTCHSYFSHLRHSLRQMTNDSVDLPDSSLGHSRRQLRVVFLSALGIAICAGGAGLAWVVISVLVAFQAPFPRGRWLEGEILLGLYGFALIGAVAVLASLERSWSALPTEKKRKIWPWAKGSSGTDAGATRPSFVVSRWVASSRVHTGRGIQFDEAVGDESIHPGAAVGTTSDVEDSDEEKRKSNAAITSVLTVYRRCSVCP